MASTDAGGLGGGDAASRELAGSALSVCALGSCAPAPGCPAEFPFATGTAGADGAFLVLSTYETSEWKSADLRIHIWIFAFWTGERASGVWTDTSEVAISVGWKGREGTFEEW